MKGLDSIWICGKCNVSFNDEAECAEHEGFCKGRPEREVKDTYVCKGCGGTFPKYDNYETVARPKCPCEGKSTLTVELTEEEREQLEFALDIATNNLQSTKAPRFITLNFDNIRAKLRPKKESVEFDVGPFNEYHISLQKNVIRIQTPLKESWKESWIYMSMAAFDELVEKVHAHVDEVK